MSTWSLQPNIIRISSPEGSYGHRMLGAWKEPEIHPRTGMGKQKEREH
jgi:hypothetical protein